MQDVTTHVLQALALVALAIRQFGPPAVYNRVIYIFLVVGLLAWWLRVRLPISSEVERALPLVILSGWFVLGAFHVPRWVGELRGTTHNSEP